MAHRRNSFVILCLATVSFSHAQIKTYLALGDSLAWGYQPNDLSRSPGDKGYVKFTADWLGTQFGSRPTLINLGVPGETTASFSNASEIGALLNSNYPLFGRKSQFNLFKDKVAQELSRGHLVTHVTIELGGNDLLDLLTTQFLALPFSQQTAQVDQALLTVKTNLGAIFSLIRQQLPSAILVVPGYYNPYGAYPGTPSDNIARYAMPKLNQILLTKALEYSGRYADTYRPFVGNELNLTWIASDDIHCNSAGYVVYGQRVVDRLKFPFALVTKNSTVRD